MNEIPPSVTVVIAARPEQTAIKAIGAARRLEYPPDGVEILVARGRHPSVQRNAALRSAHGDWIYFLDDDSEPEPGNLQRVRPFLEDPAVGMVGGPNLCPADAPPLEQVFALVLGSWLVAGPSRARYARVGAMRETSEKELILCNLMARREALLELGGFNEALYPNEENALMDQLQQRGGKLVYDPAFAVYRRPRGTLRAFARMFRTYGRGRAEQFRVRPTMGSLPNFVPPAFCLYLAALAGVWLTVPGTRLAAWSAAPLVIYAMAVLLQTAGLALRAGAARAVAAMPLLVTGHVLYGLGFWRGLFTRLTPAGNRRLEVVLEWVSR